MVTSTRKDELTRPPRLRNFVTSGGEALHGEVHFSSNLNALGEMTCMTYSHD